MPGIRNSRRGQSEFERALATVRKAQTSGRELRVDKKGNLKVLGFFSGLYLRYKVDRMSGQGYQNYVSGERSATRTQVLQKLEGLAKQAREKAILDALSGVPVGPEEREAIESHLAAYTVRRIRMRPQLGGETVLLDDVPEADKEEIKRRDDEDRFKSTNDLFNLNALDFLQKSKISMFVRSPVAPRGLDPQKPVMDELRDRTGQEKKALSLYLKSWRLHKYSIGDDPRASEKIIDETNFREDPGKFMLDSHKRVQFFDPAEDADVDEMIKRNETGVADHGDQSPDALEERQEELEMSIDVTYEGGTNRAIYSSPNRVWNKEDFRMQAGKRVASEISRRERLGEGPAGEGIHDKAVDFICFLRKAVQKKFTGKGELPEQFQAFFNENSAVSISDSPDSPDRLLPSKKLARMAVNLCADTTQVPEAAQADHRNRQEPAHLGFSDDVGVREIPSRSSEQRTMRFAVQNGKLGVTPEQKQGIFVRDGERLEAPAGREEALDGVTEHYGAEDELPEDFEKFTPDGDPYVHFPGGLYSGLGHEGANPGGDIPPLRGREVLGVKWVNKQYASWSASQRR